MIIQNTHAVHESVYNWITERNSKQGALIVLLRLAKSGCFEIYAYI